MSTEHMHPQRTPATPDQHAAEVGPPAHPRSSSKGARAWANLARRVARKLDTLLWRLNLRPAPGGLRNRPRPGEGVPTVGRVCFGDLRRLRPVDDYFGMERGEGWVIDRYYIERFLRNHSADIRGHVLEIGEPQYTRKFGGDRVSRSDVLAPVPGGEVTIVADLTNGEHIPSDTFDCIICTQTLQFIFDVSAATRTLHRILKPGGTLLLTLPGISQLDTYDSGRWGEYWRFTNWTAQRLLEPLFPADRLTIGTDGNVLAAASFLYGLVVRDLRRDELEYNDPVYPVLITARAIKSGDTLTRTGRTAVSPEPTHR